MLCRPLLSSDVVLQKEPEKRKTLAETAGMNPAQLQIHKVETQLLEMEERLSKARATQRGACWGVPASRAQILGHRHAQMKVGSV